MWRAAVSNSAFSGTRPTISLHVGDTPCASRFHLHHVVRAIERRLLGVDEIHRHLRLSIDLEAESLHVAQTAATSRARAFATFFATWKIGRRAEVDVVGDEERTRADRDGAGGRVNRATDRSRVCDSRRRPSSRRECPRTRRGGRRRDSRATATSRRARRGRRGSAARCPTRSPSVRARTMQSSIVVPSSGMNGTTSVAPMRGCSPVWCVQVDQLVGLRDARERGVDGVFDRHDEGDDGAVVRLVGRDVEDGDAFDGGDRVADLRDDLGTTAFREIRNAFDELHLAMAEDGVGRARARRNLDRGSKSKIEYRVASSLRRGPARPRSSGIATRDSTFAIRAATGARCRAATRASPDFRQRDRVCVTCGRARR